MKNTKRILALLLALVMVMGLVACGEKAPEAAPEATPEAAPEATPEAAPEAAPESSEPVHLLWYIGGAADATDIDTVAAAISDYCNETYGMNIELEMRSFGFSELGEKMQMVMASGEEFDICFTSNWSNDFSSAVSKNAYLPLDELLEEYGQEMMDVIPEALFEACRVNGSIYAVPNWQITSRRNDLIVGESYVNEFGLDVNAVDSLEDLEEFFIAIKDTYGEAPYHEINEGRYYLNMGYNPIVNVTVPGVIKYDGSDYTVYNQFKTEEYSNWVNLLYRWEGLGLIDRDSDYDRDISYKEGKTMAILEPFKPGEDVILEERFGQPIVNIPMSEYVMSGSAVLATTNAISRTSENPEVAMQFLNYVNTDPVLFNLLCFGIEGVHYTLNDDGTASTIEGAGWNPNMDWSFGNQFLAYPRAGQSATIWEETKAVDETAVADWTIGFTFNAEPVATQIAACSAIYQEYMQMEAGLIDPAVYLPEMVERLDQAGAQEIIDEMQAQIDAWLATK